MTPIKEVILCQINNNSKKTWVNYSDKQHYISTNDISKVLILPGKKKHTNILIHTSTSIQNRYRIISLNLLFKYSELIYRAGRIACTSGKMVSGILLVFTIWIRILTLRVDKENQLSKWGRRNRIFLVNTFFENIFTLCI